MHKIESMKTGEKYWKILLSLPRFEPGPSGVVLQCANHYTNRAIILTFHTKHIVGVKVKQC